MKFESLKGVRLQGIGKSIHKFFLMITYPFRHSFKFLGFVIVGVVFFAAVPMIRGVSFGHILDWYMLKYDEVKTKSISMVADKPEPIERKIKNAFKKEFKLKKAEYVQKPSSVTDTQKSVEQKKASDKKEQVARKIFKLNSNPFRHASVKNTWSKKKEVVEDDTKLIVPEEKIEQVETSYDNIIQTDDVKLVQLPQIKDELSYRKLDTLQLEYEENPEHINGLALVFGPNDMAVGDRYVVLYGIYTDNEKHDVNQAVTYMKELADKKEIECDIVAYTKEHHAAAICFLDGKNINKNMVDAGFADNIAL